MNAKKSHLRIVLCICCVTVFTLSMGWFASKFIPGTPRNPQAEVAQAHQSPKANSYQIVAEDVLDTPWGDTWVMEDLNQGKAYRREAFTDEEWASIPDEIKGYIEQHLPVLATESNFNTESGGS